MIFTRRFLASLLLLAALAACSVLDLNMGFSPALTDTPTATLPAPTGTPTIDWFPATATNTSPPYATQTATPEMRPGLGQTTLSDSFTDEEDWNIAFSDDGRSSIDRGRLTLAVQPEVYMLSLRRGPLLGDFYAEITASLNLCRGSDDYGLLVRANAVAYYRFSLSCNGTVRADRISVGMRQSLQEEVPSGDAPRGSPGEVRIGLWAVGSEMRLFLNGRYQFTVRNPNYRTGTIGVFARSAGDTPVTVSFSDLVVQEVEYVPPPTESTPQPGG